MLPKVSIVIPGYNCAKTIEENLRACFNQDYLRDLYEVIFVDDGSTDNTGDIVRQFPVKYIYQKNSGPAQARNKGWQEAEGEIIIFTDSDCIPDKQWIKNLVRNFNHKKIGAVGGSYGIKNSENLLASCIHAEILWRHQKMSREVKALGSYNLAIPKKILLELNGFEESYLTASGEDNDLSYRLLKKGYRLIFEPNALVYHYYPERIIPYLKHQFRHGYWRVKLYRDHIRMIKGDDYSNFLDYFSPLLALSFFLTPLLFIELFRALRIVLYTKKIVHFFLFFIILLRDFWRGAGLLLGIFKFLVLWL
ncbi:MAG: glycosyltransferase [Candidatus Omnitrophica bacterium]|nr:glycosyltransferase [Candidatus Omnitrophota bacterium]